MNAIVVYQIDLDTDLPMWHLVDQGENTPEFPLPLSAGPHPDRCIQHLEIDRHCLQYNLNITLPLGSTEADRVISETVL